jgi:cell division protease FtsH
MSYGKKEEQIFLGRELAMHKDYSEETARKIDREVGTIVHESYEQAKRLLADHIDTLHNIATELIRKEVLNADELDQIIHGGAGTEGGTAESLH